MFSCGMFSALAARIAVRSRGFPSGSPPPLAAIEISLIMRVNILPRLASSAPFLCLIVAHLEWPDMGTSAVVKDGGADTHLTSEYTIGGDGQDTPVSPKNLRCLLPGSRVGRRFRASGTAPLTYGNISAS